MIYVECNLYDGIGELSATALRLVKTTPGGSVFWRTETHPDRDAPSAGGELNVSVMPVFVLWNGDLESIKYSTQPVAVELAS
ncbi:uncharacterized protein CIMG_01326 [Coccidioides immitis RS]|uniref:Uncharacterized protein n=1 Tax=Coccidioides immitis (strain RS) TaxID=246410 RepID=J3KIZ0_COCIM|nr:uncharacterized protein CIMG_01326 [Coccidioides immitis RS]EAS35972.3 hypothetical protein CIMG_01326 [Coccidioides immitis RS]